MHSATGYDALEDTALVALVDERDGGALDALYRRYGAVAFALARRILGDEQSARDVVREVFLTVWRTGRADHGPGAVSTLLLAMTHRRAVEAARRGDHLRRRHTIDETLAFDPPVERDGHDPLTAARRLRVRLAVADLPQPQREVVGLAYFGGHTQHEIAAMTRTPVATVKSEMLAAMRALRMSLDAALVTVEDAP